MHGNDASSSALDLFDELVELPPDQRTRFLTSRCADPDTRREVESLLNAHDDAGGFFSEPSRRGAGAGAGAAADPEPGSRIGAYELLETLGEGGFARVYRARQHHPVRREVALKLIKLGMDTRAVIARFEQERQALAMMDHPGIAAVYDAGVTDAGRPYFVMELVRGQRINRYCEENHLDVKQRVRLFVDVCHAVHHAHQKGILHRDLKPSNVLVTTVDERPAVKVIDFGIAKATQGKLTDSTIVTQERQFLGTPQYMSPEQAISGGADVDTRSDVCSLGAVLYELLTGASPLDDGPATRAASQLEQLQRLTSDREIVRPSARVPDPSRRRELRGELDWVIGTCLEKDRARRYESVAALASDLTAFLDNRPVTAAPPSAAYRARKFVRRNALAVGAATIVALTLLVGIVVSAALAVRATRAERLAQSRLVETRAANENLKAVNEFFTHDVIGSSDPGVARGKAITVREALDNAAVAIADKFAGRPLVEAPVRESIAWAYHTLGENDAALPHARRALDLRNRHQGPNHPDTLLATSVCASVQKARGQLAEALTLYKQAWEGLRRVSGEDDLQTLNALDGYATTLTSLGRWAEAEPLAKMTVALARRALGEDHFKTISATGNYTRVLHQMGRYADLEPLLRAAMERSARTRGEDYPDTLTIMHNYAITLTRLERFAEAEQLHQKTLALRRRVLGEDHPMTLASRDAYAGLLYRMGRHDEAGPLYEEALQRTRLKQGEDHPDTITAMNNYSVVLHATGRTTEAEALQRQVLERRRRVQGEDHPDTLSAMNNYARTLNALGRRDEAEALFQQALQRRRRVLGDGHPDTLTSLHNCGDLLRSLGRDGEAEPMFAEVYQRTPQAQVAPAQAALLVAGYGPCLARLGRYREADAPLREAYRRLRETNQTNSATMRDVLLALVDASEHLNRPDDAARWRAELDAARAATQPASRPTTQP